MFTTSTTHTHTHTHTHTSPCTPVFQDTSNYGRLRIQLNSQALRAQGKIKEAIVTCNKVCVWVCVSVSVWVCVWVCVCVCVCVCVNISTTHIHITKSKRWWHAIRWVSEWVCVCKHFNNTHTYNKVKALVTCNKTPFSKVLSTVLLVLCGKFYYWGADLSKCVRPFFWLLFYSFFYFTTGALTFESVC